MARECSHAKAFPGLAVGSGVRHLGRNREAALERNHVLSLASAKSWKSFKPAARCSTFSAGTLCEKAVIFPMQGVTALYQTH